MDTKQYLSKLEDLKKEFEELKDAFSKFNPLTDWNKVRIDPLLRHLGNLMTLIQSFPNSIKEQLVEADVNYFQQNIYGLKSVLKSEQDYMRSRNAVHR
jgi:hypothetical protein